MSIQEASQRGPSPIPLKPEAKPRPEIPPKPSMQSTSPPLDDSDSIVTVSEGKVKSIVNKFSKQEQSKKGDQPSNGVAEVTSIKHFKRPPTTKPKPRRTSLPIQQGDVQAPPLPVKRTRRPKEIEQGEEANGVIVQGGRSGKLISNMECYIFVDN